MTDATVCLDFGSHTTKVLGKGRTPDLYPTCFIRHISTGTVVAVGDKVTKMLGKLPHDVEAVFPIRGGQIVDSRGFSQFVQAVLSQYVPTDLFSFLRPVELRAGVLHLNHQTQRAALERSLRPFSWRVKSSNAATALWAKVREDRLFTNQGCVIDLGAMTTKMYLFAEGQLSSVHVAEFGGDDWTAAIIHTVRQECHLETGWATAEELKRKALHYGGKEQKHTVQGKDVISGLPTTKVLSDSMFSFASAHLLKRVITTFEEACQNAQPYLDKNCK
jgi:actin-like ATPase involved in cell morphogenesis